MAFYSLGKTPFLVEENGKKEKISFAAYRDEDYQIDNLSDYSRIELNRMLDEGVNFTISTMRTPDSLMKPMRDIRLKLPVIAMDGAVLYDINENAYLKVYVISNIMSLKVFSPIEEQGLSCFANVIIDDMLVIYYKETEDDVHRRLIKEMRISEKYDEFEKNSDLWKYSGTV